MRLNLMILAVVVITSGLLYCNAKRRNSEPMDYAQLGDAITSKTQDTLSTILKKSIQEKGYAGAIDFCNIKAMELANTYGNEEIRINRTSLKVRNTDNLPDKNEAMQLEIFLELASKGELPSSKLVVEETGRVHYYKPIIIQALCLNCHGKSNIEIAPETFAVLNKKYPNDQATGYILGEWRGLWHLTFDTEKEK